MTDYHRMVFERLGETAGLDDNARAAIFSTLRQEIAARHAGPERHAELEKLEKAIRRHEVEALREQGAPQLLPDPDLVHHDEIYAAASFENLATGEIDKGSIGWRAGLDPWVLLQVHGKAEASAGGPTVQQAYNAAARKLARHGYAACLDQGSFPFSDTHCQKKRYKRMQDRRKLAITFAFAAVLLSLGIMIGIGLSN